MDNKHKRSYKQPEHSEKIAADDFAESNSPVDPNNPVSAEVVVDEDEEN
jgi:hypothetical protein